MSIMDASLILFSSMKWSGTSDLSSPDRESAVGFFLVADEPAPSTGDVRRVMERDLRCLEVRGCYLECYF